jgi:hypothetical protein
MQYTANTANWDGLLALYGEWKSKRAVPYPEVEQWGRQSQGEWWERQQLVSLARLQTVQPRLF